MKKRYKIPVKIRVGKISGSFLGSATITDIVMDYTQAGQQYRMVEIPKMEVSYKTTDIWNKRWILERIEIQNPKIVLKKTPLFDFKVEQLIIRDGLFQIASDSDSLNFDSLNFDLSVTKKKTTWDVVFNQARFNQVEKNLNLKSAQGKVKIKKDKLKLEDFLRSEERSVGKEC